ncbi:uncharacterized protein DS421_20g699950 [Arachis hypogaea]|nr:uncharacterized protein DS421_20g699950 [Arachis hypogaea]
MVNLVQFLCSRFKLAFGTCGLKLLSIWVWSRGSSLGVWILESEVVLGCILAYGCIYVYICLAYSPSNLCMLLLLEVEGELGVYFGILGYFENTYVCLYVYIYPLAILSFAG